MPEQIGLEAIFKTEEFERGLARYVNSMADAVNRTRQAQGGFEAAGATMAGPLSAGAMAAAMAVGQVLARAFEKVMELLVEAGRRVVDFGRDAVMTAARVDELNIVLETIGRNAGLDVEGLHGLVQQIKDLGITTDVAQGLVIQFSRWELNMAQATELARLAQDAAVISMQDSSEALDGLMHGIVTMNTRVLRTYGITLPSVTDSQEEYAASLGLTRDQLDETQMIQAVLNAVLEQGTQIAGAYEAAMETPGKQLRSMARYTQELAEAMGEPFQGPFGLVVGLIKTFAQGMTSAFEAGGPLRGVLEGIAEAASSVLAPALEDLVGLFEDLFGVAAEPIEAPEGPEVEPQPTRTPRWRMPRVTVLGHVPEEWEQPRVLKEGFQELTEAVPGRLDEPIARLMEALAGLNKRAMLLFDQLGLGRPSVDSIADAIVGLIDTATGFVEGVQGIIDWLREKLPGAAEEARPIFERLQGAFDTIKLWWEENGPRVEETVTGLFDTLGGVFEDLKNEIAPFITDVLDKFGAWWDEHGPTVTEAMLTLQEAAATLFGWLAEQLPPIWEIVKPALMGLMNVVLGIVGAMASIITGDWEGLWATIEETVGGVWEAIKTGAQAFADWIAGWFGETWEGILAQREENWEMLGTILALLWDQVKTAVQTKLDEIIGVITGMVSRFVEAGRSIIQGLIDGVRAMATRLVNAATEVVSDAIEAARRLLGVGSPSKLFMEIGVQSMAGFAEGLLAGADVTERAMNMAMALTTRPSTTASAPIGGGGVTYNNQTYNQGTNNVSIQGQDLTNPFVVRKLFDAWLQGG